MEMITKFPYWLNFKEVDTIEFRNPKVFISNVMDLCRNFQHLIVNPNSANYCVMDDVLFSKDKTQLLLYPGFKKDVEYVVPEGTLEIGSFAFKDNSFCKSIQLPTTLRELCSDFIFSMHSLENLSIPESVHDFQFLNVCRCDTIKYFKLPKSIHFLDGDSIHMGNAVIDATEVEYFMENSVFCKKLIISDTVKYIARGAFYFIKSLKTPELKLYKFIASFFPLNSSKIIPLPNELKYVEVIRQDDSVLNFAFPILKGQKYQQAIFSSWNENGISIERYTDALVQIENVEMKYKAIAYCLEHNSGELVKELLSKVGCMAKGFISWVIDQGFFDIVVLLCKSGVIKPVLAKELLKGELPNVLVPVVMNVLKGKKQDADLFL